MPGTMCSSIAHVLALAAYGAAHAYAQQIYSNTSRLTSTFNSTIYLTSNSTITERATYVTPTSIPTSSYISLVTTGLNTIPYDNPGNVSSFLTPYVDASSYIWYQANWPTILGTVYIVINNLNQTSTFTSTDSAAVASNTMYKKNGTLELLTRTDVNDAGTVTFVIPTGVNGSTTVAYPTPFFTVPGPIYWTGAVPSSVEFGSGTIVNGSISWDGRCCEVIKTSSAVPQNHYPFPSSTGNTNTRDPSGWLYSMTTEWGIYYTGSRQISQLLAPATINSVLNYCPYVGCPYEPTFGVEFAVQEVAQLLTTTVHVTVSTSTSALSTPDIRASPAATKPATLPQTASSVEVDPVTASPVPVSQASKESEVERTSSQSQSTPPQSQSSTTQPQSSATQATAVQGQSQSVSSSADNPAGVVASLLGSHATVTVSTRQQAVPTSDVPTTSVPPASTQTPSVQNSSTGSAQSPPLSSSEPSPTSQILADSGSPLRSNTAGTLPAIIVGGSSITANSASQYVVSGQTLALGSSITIGSGSFTTIVGLQTADSQTLLVVGSSASTLQVLPALTPALTPITTGSVVLAQNADTASQYVVSGQTLALGSSITVGSGFSTTVLGLQTADSRTVLVVGSSTSTLQVLPATTLAPTPITIGSVVLTPITNSQYAFGSQTLAHGSSITLGSGASTTILGLQTSNSETLLVVGSSTKILGGNSPTTLVPAVPEPITVGSAVVTPNSASEYIIGSQTLTPGGSITLGTGDSKTIVALQTSGSETLLVVGTSTSVFGIGSPTAAVTALPKPITVGSALIAPNSASEYVIGSQTLSPGGLALTISGTRFSLASGTTAVVIASSTGVLTSGGGLASYIGSGIGIGPEATSGSASSGSNTKASTSATADSSGSAATGSVAPQGATNNAMTVRLAFLFPGLVVLLTTWIDA